MATASSFKSIPVKKMTREEEVQRLMALRAFARSRALARRARCSCSCTGGIVFGDWDSFELNVMLGHPICEFCMSTKKVQQQPRPCNAPSKRDMPKLPYCGLPPGLPRCPQQQQQRPSVGCTAHEAPAPCTVSYTDEEMAEDCDEAFNRYIANSGDDGYSLAADALSRGAEAEPQRSGPCPVASGAEDEGKESPEESDCDVRSEAGSSGSDSDSSCRSMLEPELDGMLCAVVLDSLWGDDEEC